MIFSDDDILERFSSRQFQIIAVDAPLTIPSDFIRKCDVEMKRYGAMPLKLKSIRELGTRAISLINEISHPPEIIEVFPTGTSKILKIYNKNLDIYKKNLFLILANLKLTWEKSVPEPKTKHEIDSVLAAVTAWLYYEELILEIGDKKGKIIIPDIDNISLL